MFKQWRIKLGSASFIMALFFIAFVPGEALSQSRPAGSGGTLTVAHWSDHTRNMDVRYLPPISLYPAAFQIYESLVGYGAKGVQEIIPWLAESWKQVDPLTYLFYLRKGVKFHNGREMISEDVKTWFDWNLKTPEGWLPVRRRAYLARVVDKVEIVDRYTVRVKLKAPFALLVPTLRIVDQGIAPPEEVKKWGKDFTLHPSGTGAFKFVEVVPGDRVVLERFEGYWGKRPNLDRVIFRTIPDEQARIIALQKGEIDVTRIDLSGLPVIRKDPNLRALVGINQAFQQAIWFNMRNWPMSSLKFRKAFVMGADWDKFAQAAYAGIPLRTPLQSSWAANPKAKELLPPFDPESAKRLIKEVETEAGRPIPAIRFLISTIYINALIAELAKTQLKRIGVELRVDVRENVAPVIQGLNWDTVLVGDIGAGADPYLLMTYFTTVGTGDVVDGKNRMAYNNPKIDEILDRAIKIEDRVARAKLYQEIEAILLKDLPAFYIYGFAVVWPMSKKVQDFGLLNDGGMYLSTPWNNTWMER